MPKLEKLTQTYKDLADHFQIIGIHEADPGKTLSGIRAAALQIARDWDEPSGLLRDMVLDVEQGMFARYDPDGLGDTVLLDERGKVIACGDGAKTMLRQRLDGMRAVVDSHRDSLRMATDADAIKAGIRALYALELPTAEESVAEFLTTCTKKTITPALAAILEHGGAAGLELLGGPNGLASEDKKRRDAVLSLLETTPQPGLTDMLHKLIATPKLKNKMVARALVTMVQGDPGSESVHQEVLTQSKVRDTTIRRHAAELLGTVGTPAARERLMEILAKDRSAPVRRHAIRGLAKFGDEEAKARITELSTEDRAKSVRAVAAEALAAWDD